MIGFIVHPYSVVENNKTFIYLFGRLKNKKSFCCKNLFKPYFYIKKNDLVKARNIVEIDFKDSNLKNFDRDDVVKVYFSTQSELEDCAKKFKDNFIDCFESDIKPEYKFLIDNNIKGAIKINGNFSKGDRIDCFFENPLIETVTERFEMRNFKILSIDIETSQDFNKIYSIGLKSFDDKLSEVLIISNEKHKNSVSFDKEKDLLLAFKEKIIDYDPDIIVGWNVIDFDFKILKSKMESFDLGRVDKDCEVRIINSFLSDSRAYFWGRQVLDGINVLKSSFIDLDDYKLDTAAKKFSKKSKLISGDSKASDITNAYFNNKQKLIDYNLLDCELVLDILKNSGAFDLTVLRSLLTGMPLDRVRASILSMDSLYLSELKLRGFVACDKTYSKGNEKTTGGYVMNPNPGIYNFVGVFDFKSLYPSIMRTFNIDPLLYRKNCEKIDDEELIEAPNGACFSKSKGILPDILKNLAHERQLATSNNDMVSRWAIKILMSSLYGVLASPNCRFYSFEMANAITSFGHLILKTTKKIAEEKGLEVIYGDTDSTFIKLKANDDKEGLKEGEKLQDFINEYFKKFVLNNYGVNSHLEMEFEKLFKKLLMPKTRGSNTGAKKRYAGIKVGEKDIEFTGLEFVRKDWTDVSKKFQMELLSLVFKDENPEKYIRDFIKDLKSGKYDELLVYRKTLRKELDEYVKTTPPHVKAARKLDKLEGNIVKYFMTFNGPEPVEKLSSSIDYTHYIEKQVKPIAESILYFFNKKFDDVLKGSEQTSLSNF